MVKPLIALLFALAAAGCAGTPSAREGKVAPAVIEVVIKADPQLNQFQKNSHALLLCLYQLKDPDGFRQLAQDKGGAPRLMECARSWCNRGRSCGRYGAGARGPATSA